MKRLAIDPGDVHVGYAYKGDGPLIVGEWTPRECCENVTIMMTRNEIDEVILEAFVLYSNKLDEQAWNSMKTSQLLGAIKWICDMFRIPWYEQGADKKTPTRAQLRGRGIVQIGTNIHMKDAELHYYYRALREDRK